MDDSSGCVITGFFEILAVFELWNYIGLVPIRLPVLHTSPYVSCGLLWYDQ